MRSKDEGILYDIERDGTLKVGEAILIYEDGTRKRVRLPAKSKIKGDDNVANQAGRRPITQRSRVSTGTKRSQSNTRQSKVAKRISISSIDHKRQDISPKRHSKVVGDARKGIITS